MRGLQEELGVAGIDLRLLVEFGMNYGPNDNEFCQLYEGIVDPVAVHFDRGEIERIAYHALPELRGLMNAGQVAFSHWFEQLILWYLGEPSALGILRTDQSNVQLT